jgi:hypothetical protein
MTHPLIQELDAIDALVDSAAWERALNSLVVFDARLRRDPESMRHVGESIRAELIDRHRALALKLASLRAETASRLQQLGRGHTAARRYLSTSAA